MNQDETSKNPEESVIEGGEKPAKPAKSAKKKAEKKSAAKEAAAPKASAAVRINGKQFLVKEGDKIDVPTVAGDAGAAVKFEEVLTFVSADGAAIRNGAPLLQGAYVQAKIVEQRKADKVVIFKKKRRTGYTKKQGHRQKLTRVLIESIHA